MAYNSPIDYVGRLRRQPRRFPLHIFIYVGLNDSDRGQTPPMVAARRTGGMIGGRPATMSDPIHPALHDPSGPALTRPERPALRASDAEREQVVDILRRAAGDGRIDVDELDQRLHLDYSTRAKAELDRLTAS